MNHHALLLIGGIIAVFFVSTTVDNSIQNAASDLAVDIRERILQRQTRTSIWWRSLETLGFLLMVVGVLKSIGALSMLGKTGPWGTKSIALGLLAMCSSSSMRSWMFRSHYRAEAPQSNAARRAGLAALLVTLSEMALGLAVFWWIFGPAILKAAPDNNSSIAQNQEQEQKSKAADPSWVQKAEALQLLQGRSSRYLDLISDPDLRGDVRTKMEDGRKLYLRDDIVAMLAAPMPTEEELEAQTKTQKQPATPQPPVSQEKQNTEKQSAKQPLKED